jgi:hypothetical protein
VQGGKIKRLKGECNSANYKQGSRKSTRVQTTPVNNPKRLKGECGNPEKAQRGSAKS